MGASPLKIELNFEEKIPNVFIKPGVFNGKKVFFKSNKKVELVSDWVKDKYAYKGASPLKIELNFEGKPPNVFIKPGIFEENKCLNCTFELRAINKKVVLVSDWVKDE